MSAVAPNDLALLALLDAGNMSPTSCDGTARDMLIEAALDFARSRGWVSPEDAIDHVRSQRTALSHARLQGWLPPVEQSATSVRVAALETELRDIAADLDETNGHPNAWLVKSIVKRARKVLR